MPFFSLEPFTFDDNDVHRRKWVTWLTLMLQFTLDNKEKQENPPTWKQESYWPLFSKYSLCWYGGTHPGWGLPTLDGGTYLGRGTYLG